MLSIAYLFEGRVIEHLKKHKGKYALGAAAAGLYFSDDITPRPIKNIIRRGVTGQDTIESSDQLLKGYENHPHYQSLKAVADKMDKEDLNRLTKLKIHGNQDELVRHLNVQRGDIPEDSEIQGAYAYHPIFQNFRDREVHLRGDLDKDTITKAFKHEIGHHLDTEKSAFRKKLQDIGNKYESSKMEHVARKFAGRNEDNEPYKNFIKRAREEANKLSPQERANEYDKEEFQDLIRRIKQRNNREK